MKAIQDFWLKFQSIETSLRGGNPSQESMDDLLSSLTLIDSRLYYHLRSRSNATDLILSAEGFAELMPVLQQLKATAPASDHWSVISAYEGLLVFGERNEQVFPLSENENGNVLFRMASHGDDLSKSRSINFSVVFSGKNEAQQFAEHFAKLGCDTEIAKPSGLFKRKHDVTISKNMIPTYESITKFEQELASVATPLGGENDGWGCFQQD